MIVELLIRHMGHRRNTRIEVNDNLGAYWIGAGIAKRIKDGEVKS